MDRLRNQQARACLIELFSNVPRPVRDCLPAWKELSSLAEALAREPGRFALPEGAPYSLKGNLREGAARILSEGHPLLSVIPNTCPGLIARNGSARIRCHYTIDPLTREVITDRIYPPRNFREDLSIIHPATGQVYPVCLRSDLEKTPYKGDPNQLFWYDDRADTLEGEQQEMGLKAAPFLSYHLAALTETLPPYNLPLGVTLSATHNLHWALSWAASYAAYLLRGEDPALYGSYEGERASFRQIAVYLSSPDHKWLKLEEVFCFDQVQVCPAAANEGFMDLL